MSRKHQDGNFRNQLADFTRSLHPVHSRHQKIEHDNIRGEVPGAGNCILAVGRFAAYLPVGMLMKQIAKPLAHQRAVIDDQDAGVHQLLPGVRGKFANHLLVGRATHHCQRKI